MKTKNKIIIKKFLDGIFKKNKHILNIANKNSFLFFNFKNLIISKLIYFKKTELKGLILSINMNNNNKTFYVLNIYTQDLFYFSKFNINFLKSFYFELILNLTKIYIYKKKIKFLKLDPLTKIANINKIKSQLKKNIKKSKKNNSTFVILFMDIDNFKKYNDKMGHNSGNIIIKKITKCIKIATRTIDTIGRIGGDEFCAILPYASIKSAALTAKKILFLVSSIKINNKKINTSISIGITNYPIQINTKNTYANHIKIIEIANKALNIAKKLGKNRISITKNLNRL